MKTKPIFLEENSTANAKKALTGGPAPVHDDLGSKRF
jgi:hypothetical protein